MNSEALELWGRAGASIKSSRILLTNDPDGSSSRAYYAAFYAISALFALRNRFFDQDADVEKAVHGDLAKEGSWPQNLGSDYSFLCSLKAVADYGVLNHASPEETAEGMMAAAKIMKAVYDAHPDIFGDGET
ncbi:hypothetical protein MNBD_NITROSPINAE02-114 [hydrothermal vent metagenome]|uniref:HEPN domain-containing protein n=1 Tax=hydrothermal vent metagenome TaxID=652676 RepID=A0A3B1CJX7_9ZZZZ